MNQVTVTFTQEQFEMVKAFFAQAEADAKSIVHWTGETVDEIEAKFQIPHPSIEEEMWMEDMADWNSAVALGFSLS